MYRFRLGIVWFFFLFLLIFTSNIFAVLDRFNVGVGYSAANQLSISTDSPGEFDYSLYLRTADNTAKAVTVHYTGISNLSRAINLSCATDESSASDNPQTGTCLSGGPFVRGAFVAGNNNQYGIVKRFTLFCGSVQIVGEQSTNNWSSGDFYNDAIKDFLDNGASSTWCPTTQSITPSPTNRPSITSKPTPRPTRRPLPTKIPTPTETLAELKEVTETPAPTIVVTQTKIVSTPPNNTIVIWVAVGSVVTVSTLIVVAYIKIFGTKTTDIAPTSIEETQDGTDSPDDTKLI